MVFIPRNHRLGVYPAFLTVDWVLSQFTILRDVASLASRGQA